MSSTAARHTVGVMGSGIDEHEDLARPLGRLLAELGVNLLTGGGRGVMRSVSRAFAEYPARRGIVVGVLPCESLTDRVTPKAGYPNAFVDLVIRTHLPYGGDQGTHDLSRNHINVLSSDAIIALPGGEGTAAEVSLALRYGKAIVVFAPDHALVAHFPEAARRVGALDDIRRFLASALEKT